MWLENMSAFTDEAGSKHSLTMTASVVLGNKNSQLISCFDCEISYSEQVINRDWLWWHWFHRTRPLDRLFVSHGFQRVQRREIILRQDMGGGGGGGVKSKLGAYPFFRILASSWHCLWWNGKSKTVTLQRMFGRYLLIKKKKLFALGFQRCDLT